MILRSIRLQGWRCFADAVNLDSFSDGLNVIYSPNGSGKSTLFEALVRGLLDNHQARGRDVEALRPWGRLLAPEVVIEFCNSGVDYRLTKGFLEKTRCELERKEDGQFVRFAEGQAAEQVVQEMLTKNPPQRGLAKRENWGLAQVLWAPQGELAFSALSGDLVTDIHQVLGAQVSGPGSSKLERQIAEMYDEIYTSTGRLKSGRNAPELVRLQDRLVKAEDQRDEAVNRQQDYEDLARKVEDLRARQAEATQTSKELEKSLKVLRPKVEEYDKLLSARSERGEQVKAAEAQHDALKQHFNNIISTRKSLAEAEKQCKSLEENLSIQEQEAKERRAENERAARALEDKRKERLKVQEAQDETELARRYLNAVQDAAKLEGSLAKVYKLHKNLEKVTLERSKLIAPDNKTLSAIRMTIKERDEAQLRLDAALITLQVVPVRKGSLTIVEAEESGTKTLIPEEAVEVKGSPQVVVDLTGVARVRAWGPTASIEEIRALLERHRRELVSLSDTFGTVDPEALERLNEKAKELDRRMAELHTQIRAILAGESPDNLERKHVSVQKVVQNIQQQRSQWKKKLPDLDVLTENAEVTRDRFVTEVEAAERVRDATQAALATANEKKADTIARLDETNKLMKSLKDALEELTIDGKTDAQRTKEMAGTARKWEAVKSALEEVEGKLNTFEYDPRIDLEKLESSIKSAEEEARDALIDEKREEARLEQLLALGTYSSLAKIEEDISVLTEETAREQIHVGAIGLLYDTLYQCRATALADIGGPVEQAATRTLQRIAGGRLGSIKLGEYLEPAGVLPQRIDESVSISNVSGGEKEQIYIATRLALAEVLARNERHLVVLDDVLTATDSLRLGRILRILEEASEKLQIIILTCHPERYRALTGATFINFEDILRT